MAGLHDCTTPSKTLQISLGRRQVAKGCLGTQRPTTAPTVPPLKRISELLARSGRTATGHKTGSWLSPASKTPPRGGRANAITGSLCRHRETLETTTEVKSLRDCAIPSKSLQIYLRYREIAKARPVGKRCPKKTPAGKTRARPPLA